jgi:hypothetical protein
MLADSRTDAARRAPLEYTRRKKSRQTSMEKSSLNLCFAANAGLTIFSTVSTMGSIGSLVRKILKIA